ncbi:virulence protein RhuM/Fic/DOC family protein [Dyadobacter sp. LHD-138]|uniref:virulence protein RhuM/Fic/DOC family protein n=1 Tax=Dyadobacter sp. LHD-138 TaxID=3071413 RepID=UPI0027E04A5B|nr:virulence protein RhuM/Fic/DOC family protein [Dyadobacter sp. LHD-138]MDQ6479198.1 virulence protein RhuM/Fic/DOC family protein [Dyadobacter sp. LHD-138]
MENQIEIYQSGDGETQIEVKFEQDTVWLSQKQMSDLFDKDTDTIGLHLKNIFNEEELEAPATTEDFSVVQQEGKRQVKRIMKFYNLDAVISVGYRVNSKRGIQFRRWATQRLKDYLIQGYAINEKRLAQKQQEVQTLKNGIRILSRAIETQIGDPDTAWLDQFAKGLELLDDYDHENLDQKGRNTHPANYPELPDYQNIIEAVRSEFESSVFGKEKDDSFKSSVAQISKGFGDVDFYPSIEEKAATLLYLIIKNHSFVDGNKRIAAACFLLFLEVNDLLKSKDGDLLISNEALASLTLFTAASKPEEMDTVKMLIISVLNRNQ